MNIIDFEKNTPLHYVCKLGQLHDSKRLAVAKLLISEGADVFAKDCRGQQPIDAALQHDYSCLANLLGRSQENLAALSHAKSLAVYRHMYQQVEEQYPKYWQSMTGQELLMNNVRAHAEEGHLDIQHLILDLKIDISQPVEDIKASPLSLKASPLYCAIQAKSEETAIFLIAKGKVHVTPVIVRNAIYYDLAGILKYLLHEGMLDLDASIGEYKHSLICRAAYCGAIKVVDVFVEHFGRAVVKKCCRSYTALKHAAEMDQYEMVRWLIHHTDEDAMTPDNEGMSLFHLVCERGQLRMCELLLSEGNVDIHARDQKMMTPLYCACTKFERAEYRGEMNDEWQREEEIEGKPAIVQLLIERGADKNAEDKELFFFFKFHSFITVM